MLFFICKVIERRNMNDFCVMGHILETPIVVESERGNKYCYVILKVKRSFANADGKVDDDDLKITFFRNAAEEISNKYKDGDLVIVKGRIQQNIYPPKDETKKYYNLELIGERIEILN